jgi:tetratricopeptide (TPR) repeat protein
MAKISNGIVSFLALVSAIIGFIKLWQGNKGLITTILIVFGIGALLSVCIYLSFKKKPSVIEGAPTQPVFRNANRIGIIGLIIISVLSLISLILGLYFRLSPADKVIVLVADFVGPEPAKWGITDNILKKLEEGLAEEPQAKLKALGRTISQYEGSETARRLGKKNKATIVIWGWYAATEKACNLNVHFEVLSKIADLPKIEYKSRIVDIAELENFAFQIHLSQEMTSLTLFTVGLIDYCAKEYEKAERVFSKAYQETKETTEALYKSFILYCRGNSCSFRNKYSFAISDYSLAIELGLRYPPLFYNRGYAYFALSLYNQAIVDFTNAIALDPGDSAAFNNRGLAYYKLKDYNRSLADYSKAIELNPKYAIAFNNRGVTYYELKDYNKAISDYSKAIEVNQKYINAYNNRGTIYSELKNYDYAIADYRRAIKINPRAIFTRLNMAELYLIIGKIEQSEYLASEIVKEAKLSEDLIIGYYLLGISRKLQGEDTKIVDSELESLCAKDYEIDWSFSEIESWASHSNFANEAKKYIYEKTELLKKHIKSVVSHYKLNKNNWLQGSLIATS